MDPRFTPGFRWVGMSADAGVSARIIRGRGPAKTSSALLPVAAVVLGRRAVRYTCSHVFQLNRPPQQDRECRFCQLQNSDRDLCSFLHNLFQRRPMRCSRCRPGGWVMARAPVQPESSIGGNGGLVAAALQEGDFADQICRKLKIW
jgi:hypothetical protein